MAHSQLCPCPNCSASRPGGVLMLAAVIIALVLAGGAAASITAVVHALVTAVCVADGDLLVCTERCDGATPGYTEEESRQRLRNHVLGQVFADAITYRTDTG